jgi:hypothetical protein
MESQSWKFSFTGIGIGAIALLLALFHFYAGPFTAQPALEDVVANKAAAIRDATIAALKGEASERIAAPSEMDLDKIVQISTALLGGVAVILGVLGFAKKEPLRAAGGAAILGGSAIAFQFLAIALGAIILAILIAAVISQLGLGWTSITNRSTRTALPFPLFA